MLEFLDHGNVKFVISTLIAVVVGLGAIFNQHILARRRKTLWYQTSVYPVVIEGLEEQVELLFHGQHIPDAYVSIITLHYRGNAPIIEDDYRVPVSFDFGDTKVLSAEVISTQPTGINATLTLWDGNRVELEPIALNDKNRIEARVLTTDPTHPTVSGHIVEVNEIRDQDQAWPWRRTFEFALAGIMLLGMILFIIGTPKGATPASSTLSPLGAIGLTLAFTGSIGVLFVIGRKIVGDIVKAYRRLYLED
jgi:hypothetical protein